MVVSFPANKLSHAHVHRWADRERETGGGGRDTGGQTDKKTGGEGGRRFIDQ